MDSATTRLTPDPSISTPVDTYTTLPDISTDTGYKTTEDKSIPEKVKDKKTSPSTPNNYPFFFFFR